MTHKRILIVDDDPALLQALPEALQLRMDDLEIDTADSATTALERIAQIDYDAIITDIKMPGMDGLALLNKVKELRPETPTLLITGHGEHDLAVQALRGGAYDFIQKPIDRDYFVASLKRAIRAVQLTRQIQEQRLALEQHATLLEAMVQERTQKLVEANQAKDALLKQVESLADLLRQRAVELSTIIESMADGVYVCDANWRNIQINTSGATLLGMTVEEARQAITKQGGLGAYRRLDGSPLPADESPLAQALRGVTRTDYRLMIQRSDTGEDRQVRISASPIRSSTGEITGAVAVASDITQLYQLERQKDDFMSIASHELKTPLTSMKVLAQLARRQMERAGMQGATYMTSMERSITRMEQLIDDLLDVSRIEAGKLTMRFELCDLKELCRQAVEEQIATTGRAITFQAPDEPLKVEADLDRIHQVLINLLSNALKYSPTDGAVTVSVTQDQGRAVLCVRDEGAGIPAEELPHIFDRFYRVREIEMQSGSGRGLGLGLHICREIVKWHRGHIWAESAMGKGSAFYVALPLANQPSQTRSAPGRIASPEDSQPDPPAPL